MDVPTPDFDADLSMPAATRRAFQTHYDVELEPSGRIDRACEAIVCVFDDWPNAAVAVSGGKDSMGALALANAAACEHRAFHWDWGARLVPRALARQLVTNIRTQVPDKRLLVATRAAASVAAYPDHDAFQYYLSHADDIDDPDGSLRTLAGTLRNTDIVSCQIVGLRRGESGARDRKLDGLYGESLGHPAAFPLREWSARDVWAYLVAHGVPYPDHYDKQARQVGDGGPRAYERSRFSTIHDPEFEEMATDGITHWREYAIAQEES